MHQLAIWTMLEDAGFGASLQHYNPIIDDEVRETWGLDPQWLLVAQMPFGGLLKAPDAKEFQPLDARRKVFD
jgi:predicted oxidoreductase (fatty acid repression mutant protein)